MTSVAADPLVAPRLASRLRISGVVQGVGFRPFVHRLAARLNLSGYVRNAAGDVEIVAEGAPESLRQFALALQTEAPPLARVRAVEVVPGTPQGRHDFFILGSRDDAVRRPLISPDVATCEECESELFEEGNRRAGYPFITCTDCGPRHSVILDLPYDRERTTMRDFVECEACGDEYADLGDRRYHSETNCCPGCGPRLRLFLMGDRREVRTDDPIGDAAQRIHDGAIVAVRGVGGFHLAVDATSEAAVARLRERKHRDGKPLAVMVRRLADAHAIAHVSDLEAEWLVAPQRPIVVVEQRTDSRLAPAVTDGLGTLGVMLAYSPLHILLAEAVGRPLVMTSGNPASLPLAATLDETRATLGGIADVILTHDREIAAPIDDSVMRLADSQPIMMRRARGFAPLPLELPIPALRPIIGVGAHLKNTFTLADGPDAFVSQHIGDLETLETKQHWQRSREAFSRMLRIEPRIAARDLHPEYLSTHLARGLALQTTVVVQHHHAHVAAVAAEHGVVDNVLGIAFDGTGYGTDEAIWGGEFLVSNLVSYRRVGHLRYAPLPGGDAASRQGWRAALGYAHIAGYGGGVIQQRLSEAPAAAMQVARQLCEHGLNAPPASSMGRLFDAAAAILGVCSHSRFEGEAAMRLESAARGRRGDLLAVPIAESSRGLLLDPVPLLRELAERAGAGEDVGVLASTFHASVAEGAARLAERIATDERLDTAVLGGGVFQNALLLSSLADRLRAAGFRVMAARELPPNDGAISYGQAAVAAARMAMESRSL